ncbi:threonylcarbamoyl-AMP synthase [Arachnia propionica]|uniref:Threonylcarbamoyl-AMP synthase n=1 Tax=Arachnia propionica TaxID=1750 RepID=A0A3P1TCF8_9ACTN|nr:L-threonylcarbamoyladenylate synthase [Arachnia propionica]RRD07137.1 threonylcarbamoyl-AMP synthase [Arachnia propionica]
MAQYFDVHPDNPQPRSLAQVTRILEQGGLIAYPTDSCYALGCALGNAEGLERIRRIRHLGERHHFTLVISEFAQLGPYVEMDNWVFRAVKAATPGPYTFILKASREVPRMMQHPRKRTIGVRVPQHRTTLALLEAHGQPLVSSTLLLPDHDEPLVDGWAIKDLLDHEIDAVLDSGDCGIDPTTVVDLSGDEPEVLRVGAGDPAQFE